MTLDDYARLQEIESLIKGEDAEGGVLSALLVEAAALRDLMGVPVVVATQAKYNALLAKQPAVTQEELDGMRNFEHSKEAASEPAVYQHPDTRPAAAAAAPAIDGAKLVAALDLLVSFGQQAAELKALLASEQG